LSVQPLAPVLAFALCFALLRGLLSSSARAWFLDHPNPRSLHAAPVPRAGGMGLVPGLVLGMLVAGGGPLLAGLAFGLMLLSLADDWKSLPASVRLVGHLAAAAILVAVAVPGASWAEAAALVLGTAWMTNLYNFMDGADGLAGGMAVSGFGAYACAAWLGADVAFALSSLAVAAAALAFLVFNFPPARMFLGDAGSIPLGFLAAGFGIVGWRADLWPLWFPLVVFAPFVLDASVTLARRALRGERVWQAHRTHYYQRQVLMGWSHQRLALTEYALMGATAVAAVLALRADSGPRALILTLLAALYLAAALAVDWRWRARREA
jgi:UDP-N-acetylmuramyl pentapeptide phosphotransferase/UDP-N-acetylglucosamine-1-phosphate transferase